MLTAVLYEITLGAGSSENYVDVDSTNLLSYTGFRLEEAMSNIL